jgi:hypothetical protein
MPSDVVIDGARCLERIRRLYAVWRVSKIIYKVRVIQKSSKIFLSIVFTWLDRARRALQNCIYEKNSNPFFGMKFSKNM